MIEIVKFKCSTCGAVFRTKAACEAHEKKCRGIVAIEGIPHKGFTLVGGVKTPAAVRLRFSDGLLGEYVLQSMFSDDDAPELEMGIEWWSEERDENEN